MHNMAEQKNIPPRKPGRDAAKPTGVAPVCRGGGIGVGRHRTCFPITRYIFDSCWFVCPGIGAGICGATAIVVILIHVGSAAIFSGAARVRRTMAKKVPAPVTGAGDGAE